MGISLSLKNLKQKFSFLRKIYLLAKVQIAILCAYPLETLFIE